MSLILILLLEFDGQILSALMEEDLLKLIREMPDGYRTVFNMFAIEGFSHKEIANRLAISVSTVEKHAALGLRRCSEYMEKKLDGEIVPLTANVNRKND